MFILLLWDLSTLCCGHLWPLQTNTSPKQTFRCIDVASLRTAQKYCNWSDLYINAHYFHLLGWSVGQPSKEMHTILIVHAHIGVEEIMKLGLTINCIGEG